MTDNPTHTPLPCPFCSESAQIIHKPMEGTYSVECDGCLAQMPYVGLSPEEALTAWNARAVNSHHDLIEALREAREAIKHRGGPLCSSRYYSNGQCDCGATEAIAKIDAILTKAEAGHG